MIYPPSVKEVLALDEKFGSMLSLLIESQEDIEDNIEEKKIKITKIPTPFENLLLRSGSSVELKKQIERAFFFFTRESIMILFDMKEILIGDFKENRRLKEADFFDFQNEIRDACGKNKLEKPPEDEDPRITAMKRKQRQRDKIKAKQETQKKGLSFELTLMSLCYRRIGLTPLNIGDLPYALVSPLSSMGQAQEKYDNDIQSMLAGAKNIHPKYWVHDPENN